MGCLGHSSKKALMSTSSTVHVFLAVISW